MSALFATAATADDFQSVQGSIWTDDRRFLPHALTYGHSSFQVPAIPPVLTGQLVEPKTDHGLCNVEKWWNITSTESASHMALVRAAIVAAREMGPSPGPGVIQAWMAAMAGPATSDHALTGAPSSWPYAAPSRASRSVERVMANGVGWAKSIPDERAIQRLSTAWPKALGPVAVGSHQSDTHIVSPGILIDPGGDDDYDWSGLTPGTFALVIDLGGDDRHQNAANSQFGFSGLIDLSGDDRYEGTDMGPVASLGGTSFLADLQGDDRYDGNIFGVAAAVLGVAYLMDLAGDDQYQVLARGQGFAGPRGIAMLFDGRGADQYRATGLADPYQRQGGKISLAQGVGAGFRGVSGGGIGILHDGAGDDVFSAEMYAQGAANSQGFGLLCDDGGDDRYGATRYAQGQGSHGAWGELRDREGDDRYELAVGVGQGMGLDAAAGILRDGGGNDQYHAGNIAQGASRSNGLGVLEDRGGNDRYALSEPGDGWGRGRPARLLPAAAWLADSIGDDSFFLSDQEITLHGDQWRSGGPMNGHDDALPPAPRPNCPIPGSFVSSNMSANTLLAMAAPYFGDNEQAMNAFSELWARLPTDAADMIRSLPTVHKGAKFNIRRILECYIENVSEPQRRLLRAELSELLRHDSRQALLLLGLIRRLDPTPTETEDITEHYADSPDCAVRAELHYLANATKPRQPTDHRFLTEGLRDRCPQVQAAAIRRLAMLQGRHKSRVPLHLLQWLPSYLRQQVQVGALRQGFVK